MTGIKRGDIVSVVVKLTAECVGHDVKCLYKRPDGSTRPIYIPAECLETVAWPTPTSALKLIAAPTETEKSAGQPDKPLAKKAGRPRRVK